MARRSLKVAVVLSLVLSASCQPLKQSPQLSLAEGSVQLGTLNQHYRRVGQGPPLLLLHGLTNTWRVWRPYLGPLSGSHELLVPDMRGHGDTRNPSGTFSVVQVAQDMFALLDGLRVDRVQIIGYSFGGHVALRMAALQPERVEAMIVIAGAHQLNSAARQVHEEIGRADLPANWWLKEVSTWHPGGEAQVRDLWRQGVASVLAEGFAMSEASMAAIRARTLIIQGDRDEIFPLEVPLDMYRRIKAAQLWIIPKGTHSALFWQDVAPAGTDIGGSPAAQKLLPELVGTFLNRAGR